MRMVTIWHKQWHVLTLHNQRAKPYSACVLPFMQVGFFDDKVGPITLAILVLLTLLVIFVLALVDYFY